MMNKKTNLIIGIDSMIGSVLRDYLIKKGEKVIGTTRRKTAHPTDQRIYLDLTENVLKWDIPAGIQVAYFCAGISNLEYCRINPSQTGLVNVDNTIKLSKRLIDSGIFLIYSSTSLVYDGSLPFQHHSTPTNPQTEHGFQKSEVEKHLLELNGLVSIVRLTKVFSSNMPLLQNWIEKLQSGKEINPFFDKKVSPLPISFVTQALHKVSELYLTKRIQASANRDITYADIGYKSGEKLNCQQLIKPIRSNSSGRYFESNPLNTTMDCSRLVSETRLHPGSFINT